MDVQFWDVGGAWLVPGQSCIGDGPAGVCRMAMVASLSRGCHYTLRGYGAGALVMAAICSHDCARSRGSSLSVYTMHNIIVARDEEPTALWAHVRHKTLVRRSSYISCNRQHQKSDKRGLFRSFNVW